MPKSVKQEPQDEDDMDLQDAIGDVFKQFDLAELNQQNLDQQPPQHQSPEPSSSQLQSHHSPSPSQQLPKQSLEPDTTGQHQQDPASLVPEDQEHHQQPDHEQEGEVDPDMNFEAAINDAFQSLHESQTIHHEHIREQSQGVESENDNEKNASVVLDHPESTHDQSEAPSEHGSDDDDDLDLANAITDAIQSIDPEGIREDKEQEKQSLDKDTSNDHELALKSYESPTRGSDTQSKRLPGRENNVDPSIHYSPLEMEKHDFIEEDDEDVNLQNAIGNAFEAIKDRQDSVEDDGLSKVITESFQNLVSNDKSSHSRSRLDMNEVVSNIVSQINDENRSNSISEDVLQELAQEITSQVQYQEDSDNLSNRRRNLSSAIPKIDENILNHFMNEANKDQERERERRQLDLEQEKDSSKPFKPLKKPDNALADSPAIKSNEPTKSGVSEKPSGSTISTQIQSTVANAVKSAIENEHDKEIELNNLEMNDILTNAFNMAMENPTELLNNLETDDIKLDRFKTKDLNQRRLSIAESLALHRSKEKEKEKEKETAIEKEKEEALKKTDKEKQTEEEQKILESQKLKDIEREKQIEESQKPGLASEAAPERSIVINDKPVDINNQLSSVISNISNRVLPPSSNLGGSNDRNLVSIIKSMTSFLTNSNFQVFKSSRSLISIINNYKSNDFEPMFINSLNLAKNYLSTQKMNSSVTAIDNVLILFGKHTTADVLDYNHGLISLVSNTIQSIIVNFSSLKSFKNLYSKKLKLSPVEYKERIRLENRERKKRWRIENSERNKDNDLRARVSRKANSVFGTKESAEKLKWIEEEFVKRRNRRIAKQQEGDEKGAPDELDHQYAHFSKDQRLIEIVTDYFNVFSNFAPKDDPETGLRTTSATIASVAIIYLLRRNPDLEGKKIDVIMSSLVSDLINTFTSLEQQERLIYLAKGSNNNKLDLKPLPLEDSDPSRDKSDGNDGLDTSQNKRLIHDSFMGSDVNRAKEIGFDSEIKSKSDAIFTRISTLRDQDAKRIKLSEVVGSQNFTDTNSNESQSDSLTSGVKIPPYKPKALDPKKDFSPVSKKEATLKKPGAFQRPSYSKSDKKGKGFGFPSFHSTSIRH